jgi:hypothetical protein
MACGFAHYPQRLAIVAGVTTTCNADMFKTLYQEISGADMAGITFTGSGNVI